VHSRTPAQSVDRSWSPTTRPRWMRRDRVAHGDGGRGPL